MAAKHKRTFNNPDHGAALGGSSELLTGVSFRNGLRLINFVGDLVS